MNPVGAATAGRDTIAAIATPPGRGAIGVVRISGPLSATIAEAVIGRLPVPRHAQYAAFLDGGGRAIDRGLAIFFPAPRSFTGEDMLELQGHAGPVVMDLLLARAVELGARPARPGEFSERAFLNGKLDLAQAEAIADLINSASAQAARSAVASLQGEFSARVRRLEEAVNGLRVEIEASIDFTDEELGEEQRAEHRHRLVQARDELDAILALARQGALLNDGLRVVIAGRPNAGKSCLLNRLARRDRAIVSPTAGTTRDTVEVDIVLDGVPVHLTDTAGLRAAADDIEREGMRRTRAAANTADQILLLVPCGESLSTEDIDLIEGRGQGAALTIVRNKIDLLGAPAALLDGPYGIEVAISAKEGTGLDLLEAHMRSLAGVEESAEGGFTARRRHIEALQQVRAGLEEAAAQAAAGAVELAAELLRRARQDLDGITGRYTTEDLLGDIFRNFCVGK